MAASKFQTLRLYGQETLAVYVKYIQPWPTVKVESGDADKIVCEIKVTNTPSPTHEQSENFQGFNASLSVDLKCDWVLNDRYGTHESSALS